MKKPLWQMTGEEYVALHAYANTLTMGEEAGQQAVVHCKGVHALADFCTCSESQIYKLLREGVLVDAVISRIGKQIVFDGARARDLAQAFISKRKNGMDNEQ